ncbi:hypothetical protein NEMIN01_0321 [Nematocida minor]|uniref:uncharacterized protein n=1 Tax=Nematocida minor TaxID=1912983 RepID=UPI00221FB318|nr:uncharacterized protein NEMIN01_0321 [Nematocida minor]KAI5189155.1 hypothetical protein NEMIN01_0321 [Nematocida minor]
MDRAEQEYIEMEPISSTHLIADDEPAAETEDKEERLSKKEVALDVFRHLMNTGGAIFGFSSLLYAGDFSSLFYLPLSIIIAIQTFSIFSVFINTTEYVEDETTNPRPSTSTSQPVSRKTKIRTFLGYDTYVYQNTSVIVNILYPVFLYVQSILCVMMYIYMIMNRFKTPAGADRWVSGWVACAVFSLFYVLSFFCGRSKHSRTFNWASNILTAVLFSGLFLSAVLVSAGVLKYSPGNYLNSAAGNWKFLHAEDKTSYYKCFIALISCFFCFPNAHNVSSVYNTANARSLRGREVECTRYFTSIAAGVGVMLISLFLYIIKALVGVKHFEFDVFSSLLNISLFYRTRGQEKGVDFGLFSFLAVILNVLDVLLLLFSVGAILNQLSIIDKIIMEKLKKIPFSRVFSIKRVIDMYERREKKKDGLSLLLDFIFLSIIFASVIVLCYFFTFTTLSIVHVAGIVSFLFGVFFPLWIYRTIPGKNNTLETSIHELVLAALILSFCVVSVFEVLRANIAGLFMDIFASIFSLSSKTEGIEDIARP